MTYALRTRRHISGPMAVCVVGALLSGVIAFTIAFVTGLNSCVSDFMEDQKKIDSDVSEIVYRLDHQAIPIKYTRTCEQRRSALNEFGFNSKEFYLFENSKKPVAELSSEVFSIFRKWNIEWIDASSCPDESLADSKPKAFYGDVIDFQYRHDTDITCGKTGGLPNGYGDFDDRLSGVSAFKIVQDGKHIKASTLMDSSICAGRALQFWKSIFRFVESMFEKSR